MVEKYYGYVIANIEEIAKEHKKFWESVRNKKFNSTSYAFCLFITDNTDNNAYYGYNKNGFFDNYNLKEVNQLNLTIITLEQAKNLLFNNSIIEIW